MTGVGAGRVGVWGCVGRGVWGGGKGIEGGGAVVTAPGHGSDPPLPSLAGAPRRPPPPSALTALAASGVGIPLAREDADEARRRCKKSAGRRVGLFPLVGARRVRAPMCACARACAGGMSGARLGEGEEDDGQHRQRVGVEHLQRPR
jgi:hypothetical protein